LTQTVVALFLIVIVAGRWYRGRRAALAWHSTLTWMLVYAAAIAFSGLLSIEGLVTAAALVSYLRDVVIVWIVLNLVNDTADLRIALWSLVTAGCLLVLAGVVQVLTGFDTMGLSTLAVQVVGSGNLSIRLEGPIGLDSNVFAQLLVLVTPLALYLSWTEERPIARLTALAALLATAVTLMWTFSRGGLVGLAVVLGCAATFHYAHRRRLAALAVVLVVIVLGAPHLYWSRLGLTFGNAAEIAAGDVPRPVAPRAAPVAAASTPPAAMSVRSTAPESADADHQAHATGRSRGDDSIFDRASLLRVGASIFLDHPLTGVGKGNYLSVYSDYAPRVDPGLPRVPMGPHNTLVNIAAESGLIGVMAFVGLIAAVGRTSWTARRRLAHAGLEREAMLLEAIGLAIVGYLITSMFLNDTIYVRNLWLLFALAAAGSRLALRIAPQPGHDE
jgi:hypothetical protein